MYFSTTKIAGGLSTRDTGDGRVALSTHDMDVFILFTWAEAAEVRDALDAALQEHGRAAVREAGPACAGTVPGAGPCARCGAEVAPENRGSSTFGAPDA